MSGGPILPGVQKTLEDALGEAGWRTGKNLVVDYRSADGRYDRLPAIVEAVVQLKPDVIMSSQTPTTHAIRKVTSSIPIVMVGHGDPVRYGLVTSLARPEGNITGVSFNVNEVGIKLLELLKQAAPAVRRVGLFVNPDNIGAASLVEAARAVAPQLAFIISNRARILDFASAHRLPAVGGWSGFAQSGALMTYAPHSPSILRVSARYTDRLLRGARPGDLPIEQPDRFELIVNGKTAKSLGLALPPALLARADQLIE